MKGGKPVIITFAAMYVLCAVTVFALHTQMPATFGLALVRSLLWPVWLCGGLHGSPLPMD